MLELARTVFALRPVLPWAPLHSLHCQYTQVSCRLHSLHSLLQLLHTPLLGRMPTCWYREMVEPSEIIFWAKMPSLALNRGNIAPLYLNTN